MDLAQLRVLEALVGGREPRRAVGHRLVEPGRIEIVAEVVVGGDVGLAPAAAHCRAADGRARSASARALGAAELAEATALTLNSSNKGTGSGDVHSPSSHALYQPTEPEMARRTRASQLLISSRRCRARRRGSRAAGASRREASRRSRRFRARCRSGRGRRRMPGANSRASRPPPVVNRWSPCTRCAPRVLMTAQL